MGTAANAQTGSAAMSGFGAGYSAVGAYNKSKADKAAYEYQAKVQENNATLAGWQAEDAITRGQVSESNQRMKTAQLKSTQRASLAARGVALDEGSPLDILTTTDVMGERDALTVRDNAAREAWALREQGKGYTSNASLLSARADSENPLMAGAGTLLTGAGSVAKQWYSYKQTQS